MTGIEVSNAAKANCASSYRWWYRDNTVKLTILKPANILVQLKSLTKN